jgi:hypothetical protein
MYITSHVNDNHETYDMNNNDNFVFRSNWTLLLDISDLA